MTRRIDGAIGAHDYFRPCSACTEDTQRAIDALRREINDYNPSWSAERSEARAYIEFMKGARAHDSRG